MAGGPRVALSYPERFAPASLKLDQRMDNTLVLLRLSGAFCSGLIEAVQKGLWEIAAKAVIRSVLLRPH